MSQHLLALAACLLLLLGESLPACADEREIPQPTDKPADQSKPVQVFVMLGQSNMLGFGKVGSGAEEGKPEIPGTLHNLVQTKGRYPNLLNAAGEWVEQADVRYVHVMHRRGNMSVMRNEWLKPNGSFGPELGFGSVVGPLLGEPVLLLKACIGNRSLGWDLLPPGSKQFTFEGKAYAGYKESPLSWEVGSTPEPINWYAGKQYDDDVANAKTVLSNLKDYYPGYAGQGYEVAGFVWWQGHKDQNAAHAGRYEQNLVRLIRALRDDFDAPGAKFVLATIAFNGDALSGPGLQIAQAQLAVDGSTGKYPEFKNNVAAIDARPFWREAVESPNARQGYHYFHNAETYFEVGKSLGWAMVDLLNQP